MICFTFYLLAACLPGAAAQQATFPPLRVDYDAYEKLVIAVREHRKQRLIRLDRFLEMSDEKNVLILDARSDKMYRKKHIKGAIHLNFSDFTQEKLSTLIPDPDTKILIYCNNNLELTDIGLEPAMLALNISTYISLYGYGYRNIYELSEPVPALIDNAILVGTEAHGR